MDKNELNNQIILCRPAVRKARITTIRKLLKKIKILKLCKNEILKEKKLLKSQRLFDKVQILKKLKDDDVTKFALRHDNLNKCLKENYADIKINALTCLAKHEAVLKKVTNIKNQIPEWQTQLPLMLDSLGKKKSKIKRAGKKSQVSVETIKSCSNAVQKVQSANKSNHSSENSEGKNDLKSVKNKIKKDTVAIVKNKETDYMLSHKTENKDVNREESEEMKQEKMDDPFFIEKKIIVPKLFNQPSVEKFRKKPEKNPRGIYNFNFNEKSLTKNNNISKNLNRKINLVEDEKLHPSWAAKKVKLIQPFQGKKTTFSTD